MPVIVPERGIKRPALIFPSAVTAADFTGIPAWVKRITVNLNGISTNGTSPLQLRIGSQAGIQTLNYWCVTAANTGAGVTGATATDGYQLTPAGWMATMNIYGQIVLTETTDTTNTWACSGVMAVPSVASEVTAGSVSLTQKLDRIRLTTQGGVDLFDAGSVSIFYE